MIRETVVTADTIEEAQRIACEELHSDPEKTSFEVLRQPEKKKFGLFGGSPAQVRAYIEITPFESAKEYIAGILDKMGIGDVEITAEETEGGAVINIDGENVGFIIGHRGETLDAIQYLAGLVANHVDEGYYRISINIGNYREKREKTLEALGRKLAFKVLKTGRNVSLEPMNPYERRIIHTAVQKVNGAISWSEGEVINRHVVIGPDPEYKKNYRKNNYNKNGRRPSGNNYNNNRKKPYHSSRKNNNTVSSAKAEREPKNEGGNFSLYGRVDTKNN